MLKVDHACLAFPEEWTSTCPIMVIGSVANCVQSKALGLLFILCLCSFFHVDIKVVLALEPKSRVGIDVMSFERPVNCELSEYFHLMKRQFTDDEWSQIKGDLNPLQMFYR